MKSATLGRHKSASAKSECDVVQSGLQQTQPDKILWKFDCDIGSPNSPDVVNRTLPDAIVSRTTTLWYLDSNLFLIMLLKWSNKRTDICNK